MGSDSEAQHGENVRREGEGEKVDDPTYPHGPQVFRDWRDFVDRVARPLVEADGEDEMDRVYELYRKVSPYYICVSMVMMANRLDIHEKESDGTDSAATS